MSIFLAVIMVIIVGLMAFVINIGIFVKAKINLQNAVDAAAYSGAAVQARQLTNIAYMNWAMRNIYKEWMFKYYVLGQLSLPDAQVRDGNGKMDFRLPSLALGSPSLVRYSAQDPWNIPSICIDFAGADKLCNTYSLPGLPDFSAYGIPGVDEIDQAFIEWIQANKAKDCSFRSQLNFLIAREWSYGLGGGPGTALSPHAPAISTDRAGAFPRALEAAIRVRNLEYILNAPPQSKITENLNHCPLPGPGGMPLGG